MSNQKIIASLTTYSSRINTVHLTIDTILHQTRKADKVILWLNENEFTLDDVPEKLKVLQSRGLEIDFCEDIKSYKKLIPTLRKYPNDLIITFDDDIIYKNDIIEKLVSEHKKEPDIIHCVRGHKMKFKNDGIVDSYNNWDVCSNSFDATLDIFPTNGAGTLFFPNCFHKDIFKEEIFMELAPHGDDIWFKAMSLKKNVKCKIVAQTNNEYMDLNCIDGTQEMGLWMNNQHEENGNNPQIKAVFEKYDLLKEASYKESFNSSKYWEERYKNGGNSGAGSYNHLAEFKAEIINGFVKQNGVETVLEFGSGDGNNISLYKIQNYTGVDVSKEAVKICKERFAGDGSKLFLHSLEFSELDKEARQAELTLSLDVIYHLIEDDAFSTYMQNLFENSKRFVIIYASDRDEFHVTHVKHRKFTSWIEANKKEWRLKEFIKNRHPYDETKPNDTSFSDFYIFEKL